MYKNTILTINSDGSEEKIDVRPDIAEFDRKDY